MCTDVTPGDADDGDDGIVRSPDLWRLGWKAPPREARASTAAAERSRRRLHGVSGGDLMVMVGSLGWLRNEEEQSESEGNMTQADLVPAILDTIPTLLTVEEASKEVAASACPSLEITSP